MLLLAIDTSGKHGSIALARAGEMSADDDDVELIEIVALSGGTFSAQLVPQIAELLASHEINKHEIGGFAVAAGPGSFTGLRIGLAAAKALADVLRKPMAPVSLLEACAFASDAKGKIMAGLDAGRNEVYVGEYEIQPGKIHASREQLLAMDEFLARAEGWTVVTPDATLAESARGTALSVVTLAPITADLVARLGWRKIRARDTVSPEQLEANYIRRTDAEMLEKTGSQKTGSSKTGS